MDDLEGHDESFAMAFLLYGVECLNMVYRRPGIVN